MNSQLHLAKSRSQSNSSNSRSKKSNSSQNIEDIDNKNYYKLTLGTSF